MKNENTKKMMQKKNFCLSQTRRLQRCASELGKDDKTSVQLHKGSSSLWRNESLQTQQLSTTQTDSENDSPNDGKGSADGGAIQCGKTKAVLFERSTEWLISGALVQHFDGSHQLWNECTKRAALQ